MPGAYYYKYKQFFQVLIRKKNHRNNITMVSSLKIYMVKQKDEQLV